MALAGRRRSVVENMTQMAAAAAAMHLGPAGKERVVLFCADRVRQAFVKAGPTGAAVVFRLGGIQRQVAPFAMVDAVTIFLVERAASGGFGALLAHDPVFGIGQHGAPFGLGPRDLEIPLRGEHRAGNKRQTSGA